jgi:hypothetical protein
MAVSISIATQADILNRYCVTMEQEISQNIRETLVSEGVWSPVVTDLTHASVLMESSGDLIQAYQCDFTPSNFSGTLYQNKWELQPMKVDLTWTCDDLVGWFDTFRCEWDQRGQNKPLTEWDFPRWLFSNVLVPEMEHDMEMTVAFKADRVNPTVGVAGVTLGAVDGLGTVITNAIAKGAVTPDDPSNAIPPTNVIATGVITASTAVDKVTKFLKEIPDLHRKRITTIYCAPELFDMYVVDAFNLFGNNGCCTLSPITNPNLTAQIQGMNIFPYAAKLMPLPSMTGSQRLIASSKLRNIIWGRKRGEAQMPRFQWDAEKRTLSAWADFHRFYGFNDGRFLWVNDQA